MTNQEHLQEMRELDDVNENDCRCEYRQAKALEIIAETFIKINDNLESVTTEHPKGCPGVRVI